MSDTLFVGMGQQEITPPAGQPMACFPDGREPMRPRLADGAHDSLWARALALSDNETTLVVCAADVVAFQWPDVDHMRGAFAERTGLPGESLVVCGTHNHNGPECSYLFGGDPDDAYFGAMRDRVVGAAVDALARLRPARVSTGVVHADLAFNRRQVLPDGRFRQRGDNPGRERIGPVDPKVSVLRFDEEAGGPLAALFHFAAHPVILTNPNRLFTSEYPGAAVRHFESETGVPNALFLQGACGDTHPYQAITNDYANVDEMGRNLARAAASAWRQAAKESDLSLAVQRWTGTAPHRYSSAHEVRLEVTAVRIGPRLAMVFWQGEPFVELSLSVQWRSPFARTLVAGYSLGWIGYVPTRQAYELGGYGVDLYTTDPPEFSRTSVRPGTGELLVDKTVELLIRLREQRA